MKFPRPLLIVGGAPLLLVAARTMAPRASLAQSAAPTSAAKSHPPFAPYQVPSESFGGDFYEGWGTVEGLSAIRDDSSLWAIQKSSVTIAPQEFNARLWINGATPVGKMKVIFHSQFADGSPCGKWDEVTVEGKGNGSLNAITSFHPPARTGLGFMWVEVQGANGEKIGGFKKTPFAVLPLGVTCSTTKWKQAAQSNEWSREVHIFAGAQVPSTWGAPQLAGNRRTQNSVASFLSLLANRVQPIIGIPIRVSLRPLPSIDAKATPFSRLSTTRGTTGVVTSSLKPLDMTGPTFPKSDPRLVVTQTVRWKLGDSNQIDCSQVVAQLDLPETKILAKKEASR